MRLCNIYNYIFYYFKRVIIFFKWVLVLICLIFLENKFLIFLDIIECKLLRNIKFKGCYFLLSDIV